MKGKARVVRLGTLLAVVGFMAVLSGCASVQNSGTAQPARVSEKPAAVQPAVERQPVAFPIQAPYFPAPACMDLCGEPVPLNNQDVFERFDKEFTLIVYNHAQVYLWLKRMERWFPMIEQRLRHHKLPDDLKWVAIVESDLVPNVVSSKGAAGPWQFMPATGSAYGLDQKGSVDRRYDFERATDSAFLFLQDLYRKHKNWALAIASYNCGEKRVQDEMRAQGVRDYYRLRLPQETERYVIRILAIKAVLSNPNQYGYDLPKGLGYQQLQLDRTKISCSVPVPIQAAANAAGISYREFKNLNPVFRAESIPPGTHEVKVPAGCGKVFETNLRSGNAQPVEAVSKDREDEPLNAQTEEVQPAAAPSPASQPVKAKTYTVKQGDTLSGIARSFDTSTQALKEANKLKSDNLSQGQKLIVP